MNLFIRQEYDILPVKEAKNRSPIVHIQHNMGIGDIL